MDFLSIIASVNKMSIIAFVGALIFFIFEIRAFQNARKKDKLPTIPSFESSATPLNLDVHNVLIITEKNKKRVQYHKIIVSILGIMLIFFGFTSLLSFMSQNNTQDTLIEEKQGEVVETEVQSRGVRIFDSEWKEITENTSTAFNEGDMLHVGVETISNTQVSKARIKINETSWLPQHETEEFNKQNNVFYRDYVIASDEVTLNIEAQLFSAEEGWLTE